MSEKAGSAALQDAGHAIDETYRAYADAFARDPVAASGFWGVPALIVLADRVRTITSRDELATFYANSLTRLRSLGYSHSIIKHHHCRFLSATTAFYSAVFVRLKSDGTELEKLAATYLFREVGIDWKIFSLITMDLDKALC